MPKNINIKLEDDEYKSFSKAQALLTIENKGKPITQKGVVTELVNRFLSKGTKK